MSLRATLICWAGLVLAASLGLASVLVHWHAVQKIDTEMRAAMAFGEHGVHNALHDAQQLATPLQEMKLLVADLDGDLHLTALLIGSDGTLLAHSTPLQPAHPAPGWFFNLLAPNPRMTRIQVPSYSGPVGTIVLRTDSHNAVSEVWSDVILTLTVLALFCLLTGLLVLWIDRRAVQPLADIEQRERQLERQLAAVQEEERAEIAQDVHDEIGPLLFAVSVDLSELHGYAASHPDPQVRTRLSATQEAVTQIQRHIKGILERLRPATTAGLGLLHSIERIVAFWRTHYPAVTFQVSVPEEPIAEDIAGRMVRIAQESISNALRHGHPDTIEIDVTLETDGTTTLRVCDDGAGLQADEPTAGWGLKGIRKQVDSVGGVLTISRGRDGRGVVVSARFPASEQTA